MIHNASNPSILNWPMVVVDVFFFSNSLERSTDRTIFLSSRQHHDNWIKPSINWDDSIEFYLYCDFLFCTENNNLKICRLAILIEKCPFQYKRWTKAATAVYSETFSLQRNFIIKLSQHTYTDCKKLLYDCKSHFD